MSYGLALGDLIFRLFDISCASLFVNLSWDGNYWSYSCTEIGPLYRVWVWYVGASLNVVLGVLFFCHLSLGGTLLWMTGSLFIEFENVLEPYLLLGCKLLASSILLYLAAWFGDYIVHLRRHKSLGFPHFTAS